VPDLLSTDDAAREFEIGKSSLYRWLREGLLERYRRRGDRRTFVDREQLRHLVEPHPQKREPPKS
jgi:transposase